MRRKEERGKRTRGGKKRRMWGGGERIGSERRDKRAVEGERRT